MALWGPLSGTSYGIAGLLMLAVSHRLYRAEDRAERLALLACLLAVIPALNLASSDAAAVAGLVMTVLTVGLVSCAGKSLPRFWPGDFFPVFYACHLAVLGVLAAVQRFCAKREAMVEIAADGQIAESEQAEWDEIMRLANDLNVAMNNMRFSKGGRQS